MVRLVLVKVVIISYGLVRLVKLVIKSYGLVRLFLRSIPYGIPTVWVKK